MEELLREKLYLKDLIDETIYFLRTINNEDIKRMLELKLIDYKSALRINEMKTNKLKINND